MAKKEPTHQITELYHKGLKAQRRATSEYWLNCAFLRGSQWVHYNRQSRRLEQVPRGGRVQATINRLWPGSRTVVSKLVQRPLVFEVQPNSADDTAIEGAKIGDSILHAIRDEHRWEDIRESVVWSTWKGGTAAVCVDWDPSRGKPTALADDGRKLPSGDTRETALSVAEFVIEPGAPIAEEARWWIKAQALPPEQVKATYGLSDVPPATATNGLSSLEKNLLAGARAGANGPIDSVESTPLTLVLTYYERPNPATPKGKVEIVVDNKTVDGGAKDWPFPFVDYLNIATMRETMIENTWLGETAVSAARPIQAAYNKAWSNILEHMDTVGAAKMMRPQSSIELTAQYTDIIGEQLAFMDGMDKPQYLQPPQLPAWMQNAPTELAIQIDDILGVHDVSRGSAPANIESGYGLAVLAEQDATPIGKLASGTSRMFGRLGSMVLKIYEAEVKETRSAVIQVEGQPPDTVPWTGKTIAGQTTAVVPQELITPRSRAAQAQMADKMMQMGLITSIEEFTRVGEIPGERELLAAVRPDVARARRENVAMAQGKIRLPENFDDHVLHVQEHNAYRKTARYEALPAQARDIFAAHIQAHQTIMAEEAASQQAALGAGGPGAAAAVGLGGSTDIPLAEVDPNAPPPVGEQTVMDQLSGDIGGAVQREDAAAASEGAAIDQQEAERDAILQLAAIAEGAPPVM